MVSDTLPAHHLPVKQPLQRHKLELKLLPPLSVKAATGEFQGGNKCSELSEIITMTTATLASVSGQLVSVESEQNRGVSEGTEAEKGLLSFPWLFSK